MALFKEPSSGLCVRGVLGPSAGPPRRTRQTHFEVARNTAKEAVSTSVTPPRSGKRSSVWEENRPGEKKKGSKDVVEGIGEDVGASGSRITFKFLDSLILRYVFVVAYMFVRALHFGATPMFLSCALVLPCVVLSHPKTTVDRHR